MENMVKENLDLKIKFLTEFQTFENTLNGQASDSIHRIRQDAIEIFNDLGFPARRSEEWKYTSINPALKYEYISAVIDDKTSLDKSFVDSFLIEGIDANFVVLVNGRFDQVLSRIITKDENIFIGSLMEGKEKFPGIFEKHFARYADYKTDGMTALNTAFAKDGLFIYVRKGKIVENPVHVINITTGNDDGYISQPRNL
jgi:Fe-S cluster assembly protein SufD